MSQTNNTDWTCQRCKGEFVYSAPGRPKFCPYCRGQELYRPDVLDGLSQTQRWQRVMDDGKYLMSVAEFAASKEGIAAAALRGMAAPPQWDGRRKLEAVVTARVDLNTPLYFADNIFALCADCGCDIQLRPESPTHVDRICIPCAARRAREEALDAHGRRYARPTT